MNYKPLNGVVVDDDLFKEYHKFKRGQDCDTRKIKLLLHYFQHELVPNVEQYERCGIYLEKNLKAQMTHAGLKRQSLEALAAERTLYKIILNTTRDDFPYVNIMADKPRLECNLTASFMSDESRDFAISHLTALCSHAQEITIYDKYFSKDPNNRTLLAQILPKKAITLTYTDGLSASDITWLKEQCSLWICKKDASITSHHDRYLVVDNRIEIIISSGFDHICHTTADLTYLVRPVSASRFS